MALAVLECLHECPRHPYEIHQIMQEREVWRMIKVTPGSLYHTIERLARDGLIEVVETSRAGRRPERTTYRMTEAGQDAFAERLRAMIAEPATEYPQYPVAVGMVHELHRDDALVQLRRRTIALEAQLAADHVVEKRLAESDVHPLYWADVELRRRQREAELEFTRELIDRIATGRVTWPHEKRNEKRNEKPDTERRPPRLTVVDKGNQENVG
ncbi:MAG TPA: PadR family transcriptional regulator [Pseudonocardiaceae bacterium]|jgi:DNA-binding PadR family transcriptional regulator